MLLNPALLSFRAEYKVISKRIIQLLGLSLVLVSFPVLALETDRELSIEISAQQMSWNNQHQLAVYQGQVEATQGELLLQSDKLEIMRNQQGHLSEAKASNQAGLAYLRDLPQLTEPPVEAWAEQLHYLPEKNLVILTGQAKLVQGKNSFTGHKLTYNLVTQDLQATQQEGVNNPDTRVKAIFTPKEQSKN